MKLFTSLGDDLEASEEGDHTWLRRAETLIERSGPAAATEIRKCLRILLGEYKLSAAETKRVKQLTVGIPADVDPLEGIAEAEGPAQVDAVIDILRAVLEHETELYRADPV